MGCFYIKDQKPSFQDQTQPVQMLATRTQNIPTPFQSCAWIINLFLVIRRDENRGCYHYSRLTWYTVVAGFKVGLEIFLTRLGDQFEGSNNHPTFAAARASTGKNNEHFLMTRLNKSWRHLDIKCAVLKGLKDLFLCSNLRKLDH